MKYNFDEIVDRRNTCALKWEIKDNELPMWVADMDFKTAPEISDAIIRRASHGVFGYNIIPDEWYEAYIGWWRDRYGFEIKKEWLVFCTGVIPAISSIVRKLTTPAEKVLILTPVYNIFFNSVINNGRRVEECPLDYDGEGYDINWEELEKKLSDPQTTMMIFCNPHNPVGKIWDKATLKRVGELCKGNGVTVVSDEIHCDLTASGKRYTPFASVYSECITCAAPTKTFNIAGLQTAAVIIPDRFLRARVERGLNTDECAEPNSFAVSAAVAAYTHGAQWLDELRLYIDENRRIVSEFIESKIPKVSLVESEATYLLWIDCGSLPGNSREIGRYIRRKTGLYLNSGAQYGKGGEHFLRLNIACPRKLLEDGLIRLKEGIEKYAWEKSR